MNKISDPGIKIFHWSKLLEQWTDYILDRQVILSANKKFRISLCIFVPLNQQMSWRIASQAKMTIEGLKSEVERTTYKIKSPNKWEEANEEGNYQRRYSA